MKEATTKAELRLLFAGDELRLMSGGPGCLWFFSSVSFPLNGGTISWPPHDCRVEKMNQNSMFIYILEVNQ
ncbi:MAG: hypothetical protein IPP38_14325 [Bacteroidetes bacterium]|nr:hypothetical protein [Bacteroidota bacterium]